MGDLIFISDVIYGLKMDMGQTILVGTRTEVTNLATGQIAKTEDTFAIANAIYLPVNLRGQFLKSVGIHREAFLESGNREILIDKSDIPAGKTIPNQKGFIEINGSRGDVVSVDDYQHAMIVTVKHITGMPV